MFLEVTEAVHSAIAAIWLESSCNISAVPNSSETATKPFSSTCIKVQRHLEVYGSPLIRKNRLEPIELLNIGICKKIYSRFGVSLVIFYEETKTFPQIKQQELILFLMVTNCEGDQREPC